MIDSPSVTIVGSFDLLPDGSRRWLDAWTRLGRRARALPECRRFHLLRDQRDKSHMVVLMEWDSPEDFDRFVREMGLEWIERGLPYSIGHADFCYLQAVPAPIREPIELQTLETVSMSV